ncbi:HAD-IA family hydrolase [Paraglaciecola aestuariivivens]
MIFFRRLNEIKAISFDLDDTLYNNNKIIKKAEALLLSYMHEHYPQTQALPEHFWKSQQLAQLQLNPALKNDMSELRKLSLDSGFKQLGFNHNQIETATQRCYNYFYYQRSNFKLDENVNSLLKQLAQNLPLVAITNGNVNLEQIGLAPYFSACFKASLAQPMKPHASMFEAAQKHLKTPKMNILHVGDNLHKDIYGGLKAGFQTAWHAKGRQMNLNAEQSYLLPHVQLCQLEQLLNLI